MSGRFPVARTASIAVVSFTNQQVKERRLVRINLITHRVTRYNL
ncbi:MULTISPECIES: hypothetical protein [unclassified Paenibacillus]|nr:MULTISPECIES: hypothetical protein [unclassified Paenibacillus]